MNGSDWIQFVLAMTGFIAIIYGICNLGERFFGDDAAKPNLKQQPKPREYRVTVEDDDGWPLRSYSVPVSTAARIVKDLERTRCS